MKIANTLLLAALLLLMACSENSTKEAEIAQEKNEFVLRIDSLENVLFGSEANVDKEVAAQLLQSYIQFTDTYPTDDRAPDFLYKGAGIARGVGVHSRALKMYKKILADYPEFPKKAETQFLIAFTLDNDLKEIEKAKEAYAEVMKQYPDHEFASQAEERLKTIDLSDEELIELFMKRNQEAENAEVQ